jgi:hypothetical protein
MPMSLKSLTIPQTELGLTSQGGNDGQGMKNAWKRKGMYIGF